MKKKLMKFSKPVFAIQLLIIAAMVIATWLLYDKLPNMMPSHWNFEGAVDSYMEKTTWVYLFPGITLAMALMFPILSSIDPRKEKYELFRRPWLILQMVFVGFFAYLYFVSLYMALNPEVAITPFVLGAVGVLFVIIGNYLGKVRQNYFVGIKTPWTLDNEEVWNKTQRVGGWAFLIAGLFIFAEAFIKWQIGWIILTAIIVTVLVPVVYSYILYRQLKQ